MAEALTQLLREALFLSLLLAGPPMLAALAVGVVMALLQAATRVEERTLSVVPQIVAAVVALAVATPWMWDHLVRFSTALLQSIASAGRP